MRTLLGVLGLCALGMARPAEAQDPPRLRLNGDFRVRYEYTTQGNGAISLGREVVRVRAGLTYPLRDFLVARARLATGDPGDPNSTDVTLGSFLDDLALSLDVASIEVTRPRWAIFAGKFLNPLQTTELVWDGDVNPQGVAGRVVAGTSGKLMATVSAIYFQVDRPAGNASSDMGGAQVTVTAPVGKKGKASGSVAYYDYRIRSLAAAGPGDTRSNRLAPGGTAYLSDFDLLDILVAYDGAGLGERYPLRVVGDYVHNSGASDQNSGWGVDVYLGSASRARDWRFRYGYGMTQTDAVLAAFSHDNTTLGTNYEIHTLSVDAVPFAGLLVNGTLYHYRPQQASPTRDFQSRLRLNATITF